LGILIQEIVMKHVAFVLGLVLIVGCLKPAKPTAKPAPEPPAKTDPEPAPAPPKENPLPPAPKVTEPVLENLGQIDGPKMQAEYATNSARAHSIYKDKRMTLPVVVYDTSRTADGELVVRMSTVAKMNGEPDQPNYYFYFPKGQEGEAAMLQKGATCLIEGVCRLFNPDQFARGGDPWYKWNLRFFQCRLVN
jgi:hypothetical protein